MAPLSAEAAVVVATTPSPSLSSTTPSHDPTPASPVRGEAASEPGDTARYAFEPDQPGALERALQAVSGWPALLAPFLVQNIGWFIGGFCFVSGSIFLVSYTTGFAKSLTIFAVLFAYTLVVLWAGYQLRRRSALVTSSNVLMTIGVLLVPLNLAAAVRLILTGLPSPGFAAVGLLTAALCLGGLYYAAVLVSGIVDRTLQGRHPQLFLALAAMQLAVPLLTLWPSWVVLAVLHGILLGGLIYGLVLFTRDWLHSIFIDHHHIAYYAAGTLVYAALVSFVHLTWGYQGPLALPPGYYGPFLMILCGMLFYVDAQLKQWMKHDAFLSRMSFAIYGLSVLALFAAAATPAARVLTLALAVALYAVVMWQYATLPPLYLLLACSGWLYHTVILSHLPPTWYFLASLPLLAGWFAASRWALHLRSSVLAQMGNRVLVVAILALSGWSVAHAEPGLVAMLTALMVMALAFFGLQYLRTPLFGSPDQLHNRSWLYTGTLAGIVVAAYAPLWFGLTWAAQFALGLVLFAQLWTLLGVWQHRTRRDVDTPWIEVLCNSALLHVALLLVMVAAFGVMGVTAHKLVPLGLALGGIVLLQLSWQLGVRWLFYGVLGLWGAAGVITKMTYFPESGSGISPLMVALAVWGVLWWIERTPPEIVALRREAAVLRAEPPLTLLGCLPVPFHPSQDMIRSPLQQAMVLLGAIGLAQLGAHLLLEQLSWSWAASASLGAILGLLFTGYFCHLWLLPLALCLGLASWLGSAFLLGVTATVNLCAIGSIYAALVWGASLKLLAHSTIRRVSHTFRLHGDRILLEQTTHWTAFAITLLCLIIPIGTMGLFKTPLSLLLSLLISMVFLGLSGHRYQRRLHSYLLLGCGALGVVLCYVRTIHADAIPSGSRWLTLVADPGLGLVLTLISLTYWVIARHAAPRWESLYTQPLRLVAGLMYGWALLGTMSLFAMLPMRADAALPWLFLALSLALIPVAQPLRQAAAVRGIGIALLLTGGVASVLALGGWSSVDQLLFVTWAYSIWGLGNFVLPRYNARWLRWRITPDTWPWCGLGIVGIALVLWVMRGPIGSGIEASRLGGYLTAVALYLFLMLRHSAWPGFPWLAVLTLMGAGLAYNIAWLWRFSFGWVLPVPMFYLPLPFCFVLGAGVWLNGLLGGAFLWRRYGHAVASRLSWQYYELDRPLGWWPSAVLRLGVLIFAAIQAATILWSTPVTNRTQWSSGVLMGCILTLSCLHMLGVKRDSRSSHVVMVSLLSTLLAVWWGTVARWWHLPLFLALWSAMLFAATVVWEIKPWRLPWLALMRQSISIWLVCSLPAATILWGLFYQVPLAERLITLGIVGGVVAARGWQHRQSGWLFAAMSVLVIQLHAGWLFWVPLRQIGLLFPWYALQLAGLTWAVLWLRNRVTRIVEAHGEAGPLQAVERALSWLLAPLAILSLGAWIAHAFQVADHLVAARVSQGFMSPGEIGAAMGAAVLLMAFGIRQARSTQRAGWVYGVAVLGGLLGLYVRMVWLGLAPVQVWDTVALIGAAYALLAVQRFTQSQPIFHVLMVLPLLALGTVPFQLASPHASGTLLTVGMLYLCTRRATGRVMPLYLGMTALNVGIYLWVPSWSHHYHLGQLYIIPAAISMLWLLHFHRCEIKASVLHSVRLAIISILYVSATSDVFLNANFIIFIAVLGLSLAGVFLGIVLRTRAFLYAGVTFLVLNVAGQLVLLFPEQRLGKAVVLLVLGTGITGAMIGFNAQRETILRRIRILRADLALWE